MKFSTTIISIAALLTSAEASGGPANGSDCPAGEISNKLSTFASCCRSYGDNSDCRCPIGCVRKELEAQHKAEGKAPPTDDEVKGLLSKYED
ncbi:hypothetical protein PLIIFM63780_001904 [Purpureocillium lilacinum]|nr:hypothetical protein PLIIFM63780_001904 [Purpureocillium lilacinum]